MSATATTAHANATLAGDVLTVELGGDWSITGVRPAWDAVLAGRPDMLPAYWATVFTADLVCYAALPWIQTRPPRVVEGLDPRGGTGLRPFNLQLLDRTSIQANTVPSGHAATAVAVGLAVFDAWPLAGTILLVVAMGITVATVLGRYHYAIDSLLGVAVAVVSWVGLRA